MWKTHRSRFIRLRNKLPDIASDKPIPRCRTLASSHAFLYRGIFAVSGILQYLPLPNGFTTCFVYSKIKTTGKVSRWS